MSSVSLPVTRPAGRALIVGASAARTRALDLLRTLGYACAEVGDPYAAMAELSRRPAGYRALVLSLASLFREELPLISSVKRRCPQLEVWLADTDSRTAALAEAMALGADGLLSNEGLHRVGVGAPKAKRAATAVSASTSAADPPAGRNGAAGPASAPASRPAAAPGPRPAAAPVRRPAQAPAASRPAPASAQPARSSSSASPPRPPLQAASPPPRAAPPSPHFEDHDLPGDVNGIGEPVLTAEELRALLQDPPARAPTSMGPQKH